MPRSAAQTYKFTGLFPTANWQRIYDDSDDCSGIGCALCKNEKRLLQIWLNILINKWSETVYCIKNTFERRRENNGEKRNFIILRCCDFLEFSLAYVFLISSEHPRKCIHLINKYIILSEEFNIFPIKYTYKCNWRRNSKNTRQLGWIIECVWKCLRFLSFEKMRSHKCLRIHSYAHLFVGLNQLCNHFIIKRIKKYEKTCSIFGIWNSTETWIFQYLCKFEANSTNQKPKNVYFFVNIIISREDFEFSIRWATKQVLVEFWKSSDNFFILFAVFNHLIGLYDWFNRIHKCAQRCVPGHRRSIIYSYFWKSFRDFKFRFDVFTFLNYDETHSTHILSMRSNRLWFHVSKRLNYGEKWTDHLDGTQVQRSFNHLPGKVGLLSLEYKMIRFIWTSEKQKSYELAHLLASILFRISFISI